MIFHVAAPFLYLRLEMKADRHFSRHIYANIEYERMCRGSNVVTRDENSGVTNSNSKSDSVHFTCMHIPLGNECIQIFPDHLCVK